jgi:hypothetical protein
MKPSLLLPVLSACILLAGCIPESINPIAPPQQTVADPRIEGLWKVVEKADKPTYYHFTSRKPAPSVAIAGVEHGGDRGLSIEVWQAYPARIGGTRYLSFRTVDPATGAKKGNFSFARYDYTWIGDLRIWIMSEAAAIEAVKAGKLRGKVTPSRFSESVLITDTSSRIAAFVAAQPAKELFNEDPLILRKVR